MDDETIDDKIMDIKRFLDLLEKKRKILIHCVEKLETEIKTEERKENHHDILNISKQMDEIIVDYYKKTKEKPYKKNLKFNRN